MEELSPDTISQQIDKVKRYVEKRRKLGKCGKVTEDGILVKICDGAVRSITDWNREVLMHRKDANQMHDDEGPHRLGEGVTGKLAEIACRIAGPLIPIEKETGEFTVNYDIIEKGGVGYDCDLNNSVTVKTSGDFGGHISWLAASDDVVRSNPEGIIVILCRTMGENQFLIMGWVRATDLYGKWNEPLSRSMNRKKAIYYESGDKFFEGRTISVFGGGVSEVMHPITEGI